MRKFFTFSAFMVILALAGPAFANPPPHDHAPPNDFCEAFPGHRNCGSSSDVDINSVSVVDTFNYDFPVNTAAPVFAGNCAQGVSAQSMGFGGSIASGNSVCDFIAVAGAFIAGGERSEAFRVLGKAEKAADWRFLFSRIRMVITLGIL